MEPRRQHPDGLYVGRDWQGCAIIYVQLNGLNHEVYHSKDYALADWVALVEELTDTAQDVRDREATRRTPAERARDEERKRRAVHELSGGPYAGEVDQIAERILSAQPPFICRNGDKGWHRYLAGNDPNVYIYDGPCPSTDHDYGLPEGA